MLEVVSAIVGLDLQVDHFWWGGGGVREMEVWMGLRCVLF
jgi:hypothetical protein